MRVENNLKSSTPRKYDKGPKSFNEKRIAREETNPCSAFGEGPMVMISCINVHEQVDDNTSIILDEQGSITNGVEEPK